MALRIVSPSGIIVVILYTPGFIEVVLYIREYSHHSDSQRFSGWFTLKYFTGQSVILHAAAQAIGFHSC
jgi:hypothetical protein